MDVEEPKNARRNRWDSSVAASGVRTASQATLTPLAVPDLNNSVLAATELAKEALAKAQRASQMQRAIQTQMDSLVTGPAAPKVATVTLDAQGRLLDERGKVIQTTAKPVSSIRANQTARSNPLLEVRSSRSPS